MECQHPVLQAMLQLGCADSLKVTQAFEVYMKLCEVDRLHNVEYFYNTVLNCIYLSSSSKKGTVLHVPVTMQEDLSPAQLHTYHKVLLLEHPQAVVNIILKTPDTSLLPYQLTEGLCPPATPESTKEKKAFEEKIKYVECELSKRKTELYEEAKQKQTDVCKTIGSEINSSTGFKTDDSVVIES